MPEIIVSSRPALYRKLLGDSWERLDVAIRRLHDSGAAVHAAGVFQVRHGDNWLTRMMARLARLPSAGEAVAVQLVVAAGAESEEWRRSFAGHPMVSVQSSRPDGLLAERMGMSELRFRLEVVDGALSYQTAGVALCLGSWRVPLPRWAGPRVTAWERPTGDPGRIEVFVEVRLPVVGRMISYAGPLTLAAVPA